MITVVLVIHVMVALALIVLVLIQKSEGGGLGIGGGGGMSGFMTGRGQANLLTRTTAILVASFMVTSATLAMLHARAHGSSVSIFDSLPASAPAVPGKPVGEAPPAAPSAPLAK